jgi:Rrf2 family transcriptional regulator, nitric oxide-sensitive transcriptional repressor
MQLTLFTDYALRTLIYLGLRDHDSVVTVQEISDAYGLSRHYMMKVTHELARHGWVDSTRGRSGGISLAVDLRGLTLGEVVRSTEPHTGVLDCVNQSDSDCTIHGPCRLRGILAEAQREFDRVLDRYTVADLLESDRALRAKLGIVQIGLGPSR